MSHKYTSFTMNIMIDDGSVTVSYNRDSFLALLIPLLLGGICYFIYMERISSTIFFTGLVSFLFIISLLGLVEHLKLLLKNEKMFLWKVTGSGFYFQSDIAYLFLSKKPKAYPWSRIIKVLYVEKYRTVDNESNRITLKKVILLFGVCPKDEPKLLEYPSRKKLSYVLFEVIRALAPSEVSFELVDTYSDSIYFKK
ncbi:MAG: hypothetical protein GQ583_09880 [Methyloprofundus sp.]|nr:hypothetical protein [Methyloprofundus sp.]